MNRRGKNGNQVERLSLICKEQKKQPFRNLKINRL